MRVIWQNPSPISTKEIMDKLDHDTSWKPQTVLTLLTRLIEREYLASHREGRERLYTPLIGRDAYLAFESAQFMERVHDSSLASLVGTLYRGKKPPQQDIEEIRKWLEEVE